MLKKLTSNSLILNALISSSFFMPSCDSSDSVSKNLSLINNGQSISAISGLGVDPDFQSIVNRFVIEANKRNVSVDLSQLDIQYGDTDGTFGVCLSLGNAGDITISPDLKNASDDFVSEIILHELGHCVLGRGHSSDPTSIMHATIIIGLPWRTAVLDELFAL